MIIELTIGGSQVLISGDNLSVLVSGPEDAGKSSKEPFKMSVHELNLLSANLLEMAKRHQAATNEAMCSFGLVAAGSSKFFDNVRNGVEFDRDTYDRVIGWFDRNWSSKAEWPSWVPRPDPSKTGLPQRGVYPAAVDLKPSKKGL